VIAPGSVLSVRKLAERLTVSPMPVREALLRLSVDEWVEVAPRSSTRVTNVSLERVREICEMRNSLESRAARLAVARMSPTDIERLKRWLKKMDAAAAANRPEEWHRWNQEFHAMIFGKCDNSLLERIAQAPSRSRLGKPGGAMPIPSPTSPIRTPSSAWPTASGCWMCS
jgi:DNA-binding GntR family transcriptional regulator